MVTVFDHLLTFHLWKVIKIDLRITFQLKRVRFKGKIAKQIM